MPGILLKKLSFVTCLIFIQPIYLTILITAHLKSIFRDCCPKHVNYKENVLKIVLSTTKECKVEYVLGIFSIYSKFIFWSLYFVESLSIGKNLFEKDGFWDMNRFVIVLICPFHRSITLPWFLGTLLILLMMHEKDK